MELQTDSEFLINCMTKWINDWKANGWKKTTGEPVVNRPELEELDEISRLIKIRYVCICRPANSFPLRLL